MTEAAVARQARVNDRALAGHIADWLTERRPIQYRDRRGRPKVADWPHASRVHVMATVVEGLLDLGPYELHRAGPRVMDARAEMALAELMRAVVSGDLDGLHVRVDRLDHLAGQVDRAAAELEDVRHRLALVEQRLGLAVTQPKSAHRRRAAVIELRGQGHSTRAIEVMLGVSRRTIDKDLRDANVSLPPDARGVDGRALGRRAQNGRVQA